MTRPEIVTAYDLHEGDVVSFEEDPHRWTVEAVWRWDDDLPAGVEILWPLPEAGDVEILFEGAACPSPMPADTKAARWATTTTTKET